MNKANKYIEIDELIKLAKEKNINLGKGNPYNRLRYYTKIGWLPHMLRKKTSDGSTKGHYPSWVINRLETIEALKSQNLNNDEITEKLKEKSNIRNLAQIINSTQFKRKAINYSILVIVILIFLIQVQIIPLGSNRNQINYNTQYQTTSVFNSVISSGIAFFPTGTTEFFINANEITPNSKVYMTFNENYSPASRFWIQEQIPNSGFLVKIDAPLSSETQFSWWITD